MLSSFLQGVSACGAGPNTCLVNGAWHWNILYLPNDEAERAARKVRLRFGEE